MACKSFAIHGEIKTILRGLHDQKKYFLILYIYFKFSAFVWLWVISWQTMVSLAFFSNEVVVATVLKIGWAIQAAKLRVPMCVCVISIYVCLSYGTDITYYNQRWHMLFIFYLSLNMN